jgi:hypothetical protein
MHGNIADKVNSGRQGLYLAVLFPIAVSFLITITVARVMNSIWPDVHMMINGIHVHHFVIGLIIMTVSNYLALVFSGPWSKLLIGLAFGCGLGLVYDECSMWLHLNDADEIRWRWFGVTAVITLMVAVVTFVPAVRALHARWNGKSQSE